MVDVVRSTLVSPRAALACSGVIPLQGKASRMEYYEARADESGRLEITCDRVASAGIPNVSTTALDGEVVIVIENLETGEPLHVGISNN